jgi:hypothetical protein
MWMSIIKEYLDSCRLFFYDAKLKPFSQLTIWWIDHIHMNSPDKCIERGTRGGAAMFGDPGVLMGKLEELRLNMLQQLSWQFPWFPQLNDEERQAFLIELLQVLQTHDATQLKTVVDEWEATAEALSNPEFMQAWQESDHPDDDVPWEQVRGDSSLSGEAEEGR